MRYNLPGSDEGLAYYTIAIGATASHDTYSHAPESPLRVEREPKRRGFTWAPRQVVVSDGAP